MSWTLWTANESWLILLPIQRFNPKTRHHLRPFTVPVNFHASVQSVYWSLWNEIQRPTKRGMDLMQKKKTTTKHTGVDSYIEYKPKSHWDK